MHVLTVALSLNMIGTVVCIIYMASLKVGLQFMQFLVICFLMENS